MDPAIKTDNGRHLLSIHEGLFEWVDSRGHMNFHGIRGAYFWLDPSLVRMLVPLTEEVGPELFSLLVSRSSSFGTQNDYDDLVTKAGRSLREGFLAWGRAVATAGWGRFEVPECDEERKQAVVIVRDSWELALQKEVPAEQRWGSPFLQGKIMGIFSIGFGTNCWADPVDYPGVGEEDIAFKVTPSARTIESSLSLLRRSRMQAEARRLAEEVDRKTEELQRAEQQLRKYADGLEELVARQTEELRERNLSLIRSQNETRAILQSAPNLIVSVDLEGRILFSNRPDHTPGSSTLGGLPSSEVERQKLAQTLARVVETRESAELSIRLGDSHQPLDYLLKLAPVFQDQEIISVTVVGVDLTARKQTEEQFSHAQRLESLGHLAGGVAHDFNNMLTAIIGAAEMARSELSGDPGLEELLSTVLDVSAKGSVMVRELLKFSRKGAEAKPSPAEVFDLNELARCSSLVLQRTLPDQVEMKLTLFPEPLAVALAPGQFEQVLFNLSINAGEAMPDGGELRIWVEASKQGECRPPYLDAQTDYARVRVQDTGTGMTPEVRRRLFDPFFTTKPLGKGTGLGLSTSYQIVAGAGGFWEVDSSPGCGSTFTIYLPLTDEAPLPRVGTVEESSRFELGVETLLLVEDDESVRRMNKRYLQSQGYRVLEAVNGADALERFEAELNGVDLVVTDVMMPKMNGIEFAKKARDKCPGLPVLFVSGYSEDVLPQQYQNLLEKPYSPTELASWVRRLLDERSTSPG